MKRTFLKGLECSVEEIVKNGMFINTSRGRIYKFSPYADKCSEWVVIDPNNVILAWGERWTQSATGHTRIKVISGRLLPEEEAFLD